MISITVLGMVVTVNAVRGDGGRDGCMKAKEEEEQKVLPGSERGRG